MSGLVRRLQRAMQHRKGRGRNKHSIPPGLSPEDDVTLGADGMFVRTTPRWWGQPRWARVPFLRITAAVLLVISLVIAGVLYVLWIVSGVGSPNPP